MTTMNVSLTPELMQIVRHKVKSGLYNNASEVVREAIRQLDTNSRLLHELKLSQLKEMLAPGYKQAQAGEVAEYSVNSLIAELNAEGR